jgi:guanosine-3',5'-bis(diphosphate) 3'-pyrophosphohydrolase
MLLRAASFAADKHRSQRRKDADASPYINHPLLVARLLAEEGGVTDPEVLCAALLHDTIEDTATTADELREVFGERITSIVLEVTDDKTLPKAERKRLQVEHAVSLSHEAKLIKLADKIANVRDITHSPPADWSASRKAEYIAWATSVVNALRGINAGLEATFQRLLATA